MARIEEKNKEKLSSVIGTWIVAGILGAVVITAIVLVIIYFVDLANQEEETEFEERFPTAQQITFEQLDDILGGKKDIDEIGIDISKGLFVFVYSPDFETYTDVEVEWNKEVDGEIKEAKGTLTDYIDYILSKGYTNFYVLNVESEDNEGKSSSKVTISNYPTLLVMDVISEGMGNFGITVPDYLEDQIDSGIVTDVRQIINVLALLN